METIFDGKVYNYIVVYIDTIIFEFDNLEDAIKGKEELLQNDFYIQKDKISIYSRLKY